MSHKRKKSTRRKPKPLALMPQGLSRREVHRWRISEKIKSKN